MCGMLFCFFGGGFCFGGRDFFLERDLFLGGGWDFFFTVQYSTVQYITIQSTVQYTWTGRLCIQKLEVWKKRKRKRRRRRRNFPSEYPCSSRRGPWVKNKDWIMSLFSQMQGEIKLDLPCENHLGKFEKFEVNVAESTPPGKNLRSLR